MSLTGSATEKKDDKKDSPTEKKDDKKTTTENKGKAKLNEDSSLGSKSMDLETIEAANLAPKESKPPTTTDSKPEAKPEAAKKDDKASPKNSKPDTSNKDGKNDAAKSKESDGKDKSKLANPALDDYDALAISRLSENPLVNLKSDLAGTDSIFDFANSKDKKLDTLSGLVDTVLTNRNSEKAMKGTFGKDSTSLV